MIAKTSYIALTILRTTQTSTSLSGTTSLAEFMKIGPGGGGTLRISGCGCAARTLEPLAYTRASFSWILLPYTRLNSWFPWSSQPTGQFCEK